MIITRLQSSNKGTIGVFTHDILSGFSLELPDYDNMKNVSCIPCNTYEFVFIKNSCFRFLCLTGIPGRSGIQIHSGSFAGDLSFNYISHTRGCILLGCSLTYFKGQYMLLESRNMIQQLYNVVTDNIFTVKII